MDDVVEPKTQVELKEPEPVCTLFADGTIKVQQPQIKLLDLQRLLLMSAGSITERTLMRATQMEAVLTGIQARYSGFGPDTEAAIAAALNRPASR